MKFEVLAEGRDVLSLRQSCQEFCNGLWVPAHLTAEQAAAFALDQFKRTVATQLELLEVRCDDLAGG